MRFLNDEKTIMLAEYIGAWTWDEFFPARDAANAQFDELDHDVTIIHDWSQQKGLPANALSNSRRLLEKQHPHTGQHIFVGVNPLFLSIFGVFVKIYKPATRFPMIFALNVEEAVKLINERKTKTSEHKKIETASDQPPEAQPPAAQSSVPSVQPPTQPPASPA
jgi:hypothetical protein